MKTTISLVVVALLASFGCGDSDADDDGPTPTFPDAATVDAQPLGCNAVSQTGCADGERCAFVLDIPDTGVGHVECIADGAVALGDACERPTAAGESDDCAKGGHCYNGTCRQTCSAADDTCDGECGSFVDGNDSELPVQWCLAACDPLAQDCVTANEGCVLGGAGGICLIVNNVPLNDPCNFANSCEKGAACIGPDGGRTCRPLCGAVDEIWGLNADGQLTWPLCCGPNCVDATKACELPNDVCWLVGAAGGGVLNVGFCQSDDEASNPGAGMPFVCNCATPPNPPEVCGDIAPATGTPAKDSPTRVGEAARVHSLAR